MLQPGLSFSDRGLPNSRPIISPRPRTSASSSYSSIMSPSAVSSAVPVRSALLTSCSSSMTASEASPAAIAATLEPNVESCTSTRSIDE